MSMKQHDKRPFFIDGYKDGELYLNLPAGGDYGEDCNYGKAAFYDYVRAGYESDKGLFIGGLLQHIVLNFANKEEPLSNFERGFNVGFFYELERTLGSHFFSEHVTDQIKLKRLNDIELSPLTFRDYGNSEEDAA